MREIVGHFLPLCNLDLLYQGSNDCLGGIADGHISILDPAQVSQLSGINPDFIQNQSGICPDLSRICPDLSRIMRESIRFFRNHSRIAPDLSGTNLEFIRIPLLQRHEVSGTHGLPGPRFPVDWNP